MPDELHDIAIFLAIVGSELVVRGGFERKIIPETHDVPARKQSRAKCRMGNPRRQAYLSNRTQRHLSYRRNIRSRSEPNSLIMHCSFLHCSVAGAQTPAKSDSGDLPCLGVAPQERRRVSRDLSSYKTPDKATEGL